VGILKTQFCENLRLERQKRKWSQENIADMLEMSPSGYAKIERGETEVSLDKVEEIADKLEIGVFELLKINLSSQQVSHSNCYNYNYNRINIHRQTNTIGTNAEMDNELRLQQMEAEIVQLKFILSKFLEKTTV